MLLAVLDTNWQMEVQCQTNTTWKLSNCISDSDVLNRRVLFHQNRQHQKAGAQLWWDQMRQSAARSQHSVQGSWPTSHDLAVSDTAHPDIHTHTAHCQSQSQSQGTASDTAYTTYRMFSMPLPAKSCDTVYVVLLLLKWLANYTVQLHLHQQMTFLPDNDMICSFWAINMLHLNLH